MAKPLKEITRNSVTMPRKFKRRRKRRKARISRRLRYNHGALKLRQQFVLQGDVNGNIQGQMNGYSLTNFFKNNSGDPFSSLQEVGSITALYDQYRPVGMRIQYIPRITEYPSVSTSNPANMPSMAWAYDVDNSGTITYGNLLTRNRCILKPSNKPWTLYFRIPRVSVSNSTQPSMVGGWNNLNNETAYTAGGVKFSSEEGFEDGAGNPFTGKIGALLVTYYMEVKERQ